MGRGASEISMASSDMNIPFVGCAEEVGYQRGLVALLADRQHDRIVPTVTDVAFLNLDKGRKQL